MVLVRAGKIRQWGVSNFDVPDMVELMDLPDGSAVQSDQVLYNLTRRGIESTILLLRQDGLIVIRRAGTAEHVRENRAALDLRLTKKDLAELDRALPPPTEKRPLEKDVENGVDLIAKRAVLAGVSSEWRP